MCSCVQIMTGALEARQPCLFFCKLGKDRTGLMAALVLAACGASDEEIVADYTRRGQLSIRPLHLPFATYKRLHQ